MIELIPLPYDTKSLEPYLSEKTLLHHYGKHHRAYVDKTNAMIANTDMESLSLEEIIYHSWNDHLYKPLFNSSAQIWNHNFFWNCLCPEKQYIEPNSQTKKILAKSFESYENFIKLFVEASVGLFGSGWVWLIQNNNQLFIEQTSNAETPFVKEYKSKTYKVLFTLDVWEHAYYIDFLHERKKFAECLMNKITNWRFIENNIIYEYF